MILPGFGLEDHSFLTRENVSTYVWLWHVNFYSVPDFPELLLTGKEREYFDYFIKHEAHNPRRSRPMRSTNMHGATPRPVGSAVC